MRLAYANDRHYNDHHIAIDHATTLHVESRMRFLGIILLIWSSLAVAQPRQKLSPPAFPADTVFQGCVDTTFPDGNTFGLRVCERYTFQPDGTLTMSDGHLTMRGRYTIRGSKVTLTIVMDANDPVHGTTTFELPLSNANDKLGYLERVR
jgi:hypothetical protein